MEKCQNFKRFGRTLPDLLSFGGWVLVFAVVIMASQNTSGCYRAVGRVARRPIKGRSPTGGRDGPSNPEVGISPQLSPQTQEVQSDGQGSERCHQHSTYGCHSMHTEPGPTPSEFFELEEPDRLPELEEFTGIAELKELPSFADFEELAESLELPECPSWDQVQEPTTGTGEEWWEVLFEGIGIFPLVQPPYDEEHSYAMGSVSGETSGGSEVCEMGLLA